MPPRIGFIGLGVMGAPMARHLVAKHGPITVYDLGQAKVQALVSEGSRAAADVAEVGRQSDVVLLSLPDSQTVRAVVLDPAGLADSMAAGGIIIDTSTTEPAVSIELGQALKLRGLHFLDAPMSGGEQAAIKGTLSFMVGGEEPVLEQCRPLLATMGANVVRVGEIGAGEIAKMVNQMIVGVTFAIVAEAFALGTKAGLDPEVLFAALRHGWAGSKVLEVAVPAMLARDFRPGGTVNIHCKDLRYALSLASAADVPTPLTALAHEVFKAARANGRGPLAQPAVVTLWEQLLGVTVASSQT